MEEGKGASDRVFSPSWQPHLQKIAKSWSKDSLALAPLQQRVTTTLQDVRKNGETLMLTAQTHIQRLGGPLGEGGSGRMADDWALLRRVGTAETKRSVGMRRSASDTNFQQRARGAVRLPRRAARLIQEAAGEQGQDGESWSWLSSLNNTLNQARAASRPKFQLPVTTAALESQARGAVRWLCRRRRQRLSVVPGGGELGYYGIYYAPHY